MIMLRRPGAKVLVLPALLLLLKFLPPLCHAEEINPKVKDHSTSDDSDGGGGAAAVVDTSAFGDFQTPKLAPGEITHIRWREDEGGQVVTPNAYMIGMKPQVRHTMLQYAQDMGIVEILKNVTVGGNNVPRGHDKFLELTTTTTNTESLSSSTRTETTKWVVQGPKYWRSSDFHWFSPHEVSAHDTFLRALSAAGFDEILRSIGVHFGFKGIACYHVSFLAVSHCEAGYPHFDFKHTMPKSNNVSAAYNILFPLMLANETEPELTIYEWDDNDIDKTGESGDLKYQFDVGVMVSVTQTKNPASLFAL
jgi:hypothetical protein